MGGGIVGDIGKYFQIKNKHRHDSWTDQFNRIFMVKALFAATLLLGINWYKSEINCIVPGTAGIGGGFVSEACWINGLYVFKELKETRNFKGYYGIPNNIDNNGLNKKTNKDGSRSSCNTFTNSETCDKMEKIFYLQYQWFPFYIALLGLLFYMPYLVYLRVNADMISLEKNLNNGNYNKDDLLYNYFDDKINNPARQNLAAILNVFVKILYLISNVLAFVITDSLLNGDFKSYGIKWFNWLGMSNFDMYNYIDFRLYFKAGEVLLPNFLLCDVLELSKDIKHTLWNEHIMVCEVKSHVLYQYVLAVIWLLFILAMCVSIIGIIQCIGKYVYSANSVRKYVDSDDEKHIYHHLSPRQQEYLTFINKKDLTTYRNLVKELQEKFAKRKETLGQQFVMG